jgi:hypothetical protein
MRTARISQKWGRILLAITVWMISLPAQAKYSGGTGEPNDPYQIGTAADLISLGEDPNDYKKQFVLTADIDLDPNLPGGRVFQDALIAPDESKSVGGHTGSPFEGVLDGRGHTIANLHIEGKPGYDAGLFGKLGGIVKDLNLANVSVSGSPCGAIAGLNHRGMILRCRVTGQVSGLDDIGGLVGSHWDASIVECQAQVQVIGQNNVGGMVGGGPGGTLIRCEAQAQVNGEINVGGLVGSSHDGQVLECRATGTAIGVREVGGLIGDLNQTMVWRSSADCDVTAEQTAGGLAGSVTWLSGLQISECYSRGSVAGSAVGGLAGEARHVQFLNCYAACKLLPLKAGDQEPLAGGLFGDVRASDWAPQTISCFWDTTLSGVTVSTGRPSLELGTGLTTQQMQDQQVFQDAGWDFSDAWKICPGDYPRLQWEAQDCNAPQL